jgi:type II secretory pathway pseudopilin PulG
MNNRSRAVTLVELVVVAGILAMVLSMSFASLSRYRELSKRLVCSVNLKGIGAVTQIYAQDNNSQWMVPAFKRSLINQQGIDYLKDNQSFTIPPFDPGEVGYNRPYESTSETPALPNGGSTAVSATRAFWILVRSGDVHVKQFVCPSSTDAADETENIDLYYDFTGYANISYGYQVPFGPRDTRPNTAADPGRIQAADKGPWYIPTTYPDWNIGIHGLIDLTDSAETWRRFNSANHGGYGNGEGQNCLHPDGSVCFHSIPAAGVDNDNIYTLMLDDWWSPEGYNRIHGDPPHYSATGGPPYPGQDAFGAGPGMYASTDSLIYP